MDEIVRMVRLTEEEIALIRQALETASCEAGCGVHRFDALIDRFGDLEHDCFAEWARCAREDAAHVSAD